MENMREMFLLSQQDKRDRGSQGQVNQRNPGITTNRSQHSQQPLASQHSQASQHPHHYTTLTPSIPINPWNSTTSNGSSGNKGTTVNKWSTKWQEKKEVEDYLLNLIQSKGIDYKYFITLSFKNPVRDIGKAGNNNRWIKRLILDYFYSKSGRMKEDRLKLLFINERHRDGDIHLHLLMERWNDWCIDRVHRRIILGTTGTEKEDLADEMIINGLKRHLQKNVKTLGTGSASVDIREVLDHRKRIEYLNKSVERGCFEGTYDHIDFMNSDL